jgi:hypothetical protein
MRKALPETMFTGREQPRLSAFQNWVLENAVTEIEMSERQFWSFVSVQPLAEKPWTTYMGRLLHMSTCRKSRKSGLDSLTRERPAISEPADRRLGRTGWGYRPNRRRAHLAVVVPRTSGKTSGLTA